MKFQPENRLQELIDIEKWQADDYKVAVFSACRQLCACFEVYRSLLRSNNREAVINNLSYAYAILEVARSRIDIDLQSDTSSETLVNVAKIIDLLGGKVVTLYDSVERNLPTEYLRFSNFCVTVNGTLNQQRSLVGPNSVILAVAVEEAYVHEIGEEVPVSWSPDGRNKSRTTLAKLVQQAKNARMQLDASDFNEFDASYAAFSQIYPVCVSRKNEI